MYHVMYIKTRNHLTNGIYSTDHNMLSAANSHMLYETANFSTEIKYNSREHTAI